MSKKLKLQIEPLTSQPIYFQSNKKHATKACFCVQCSFYGCFFSNFILEVAILLQNLTGNFQLLNHQFVHQHFHCVLAFSACHDFEKFYILGKGVSNPKNSSRVFQILTRQILRKPILPLSVKVFSLSRRGSSITLTTSPHLTISPSVRFLSKIYISFRGGRTYIIDSSKHRNRMTLGNLGGGVRVGQCLASRKSRS